MGEKKRIGLALSGGGARGYAHLGVVKALYERNIRPEIFSGTSAGALVGLFLANGWDPQDIFDFFKDKKIFDVSRLTIPKNGLMNMKNAREKFEKELDIEDLNETRHPFYVCVTNMTKGKVEYLNKGPAVDIVLASAAIPVLFAPVNLGEDLYSDGGIFDNLPVDPIRDKCEKLIAVDVNPIFEKADLTSLAGIASRTFSLTVNSTISEHKEKCDLWIEPEGLYKYKILGFNNHQELFEKGYECASNMDIDL